MSAEPIERNGYHREGDDDPPLEEDDGERLDGASASTTKGGRIKPECRRSFMIAMGIAIPTASLGDVFLKRGVMSIQHVGGHGLSAIVNTVVQGGSSIWLDVGILLMIIHFTAFVRALKLGPLSLVVPLRSSTYVITTLLAMFFLGEHVPPVRWLGILIVIVGVSLVGWSGGHGKGETTGGAG